MKTVNEPKKRHGWLWITSNARQHESLKPLISMWLAQAANCLLEMGENPERRVWFVYDELASLHQLPELPQVLSEGRKFGGCFGLGFQNKPQLDGIYGRDKANAMMDLLNSRFFFRSPDEGVAKWVRDQLGQSRSNVFNEQYSYGAETVRDGVSFSKQQEDIDLVNYSDIQSLPDLTCFITLPGQYPVVKQAMKYEKIKPIAAEFTPRPLNDSLDQEIEAEIESRLKLDAIPESVNAALDGLISGNPVKSAAITVAEPTASAVNTVSPSAVLNKENIVSPTVASVVEDSTQTSSSEGTTPTGREIEMDHLLVDTDTGEILDPQTHLEENPQDTYDNYCRMRQEEKEILVKQLPQSREVISNDEHEHEHEDSRSW